jgi:hypothetical protein
MAINCDVIVRWGATPEQLRTLGTALWRWCTRAVGGAGIYQYLNDQALADLIAGKLPVASPAERRGVLFRVRDEASQDRQATIDRLRREMPAEGVEDILVDRISWNVVESRDQAGATLPAPVV